MPLSSLGMLAACSCLGGAKLPQFELFRIADVSSLTWSPGQEVIENKGDKENELDYEDDDNCLNDCFAGRDGESATHVAYVL